MRSSTCNRVRVWYLQESAWIVFFEDFQAVLHHAGGLAQFHGAVCDLVTDDLKWIEGREMRQARHGMGSSEQLWSRWRRGLFHRNMTALTWQQQLLSLALFHLFRSTCSPHGHQTQSASSHMSGSKIRLWLDVISRWLKENKAQSTVTVLLDCIFTLLTPALHLNKSLVYCTTF